MSAPAGGLARSVGYTTCLPVGEISTGSEIFCPNFNPSELDSVRLLRRRQ